MQFSEALGMFSGDYAITINDDESNPFEQRRVTLGLGIKGRLPVVVYCYSGEDIRIISARKAGGSNASSVRRRDEGYVQLQKG